MGRGLLIVLGISGAAAVAGMPALAQDGSNPLAVTWEFDAPDSMRPLAFSLSERTDLEIHAVPLRLPPDADPGPSAAEGGWGEQARFQQNECVADPVCAEGPGRVGLRLRSDGFGGVRFGALVRFGENLSKPRSEADSGWRFFAAADAHALTWDLNGNDGETVRLEDDKVLVGDAQVGISRPLVGGDLAFGYIHREVSVEGASRTEQFGGVTFTMAH